MLFVAAWQGVASLHGVDNLTLASPAETCARPPRTTARCCCDNARVTLVEVLLGLAIAVVAGVAASRSPCICSGRCATPPTRCSSASQAIPIVVLAPIFVLAFDYGIGPEARDRRADLLLPDHRQRARRAALGGARAAQADAQPAAPRGCATLVKVELPAALPFFFSGLRVAATVSVIGAVFGEWAGADKGLGRLVLLGNNQLETAARLRGDRDPHR